MNNEFENNDVINEIPQNNQEEANDVSVEDVEICEEKETRNEYNTEESQSVQTESDAYGYSPISGAEFSENSAEEQINNNFYGAESEKSKKPLKKRKWPKVVALSLIGGILFGSAFGFSNEYVRRIISSKISIGTTNVTLSKAENDKTVSGNENSIGSVAAIAQECMPSVVAITNRSVSDVMTFFGKYEQESTSSGSGIIIGKNATELLIVTNYHVIANARELSVLFSPVESRLEMQAAKNGEYDISNEDIPSAIVKGYDSSKDLAVIAVKLEDITPELLSEIKIATIGKSSSLKPGDQVVAIGNALGYGQSVTTGIISAVNRNITMESADGSAVVTNTFIQTDAAINQGNSGGALLDMEGHVIGINSVKIATTGVEGMGYAIPISDVESIIDELMVRQTRTVVDEDKQGFLGISGYDVSSSVSQMYGIPVGVFVESAMEGLAADKAGIKKGYIITKFDGYSITTIAQLQERLQYYKDGEKVKVTVKIPAGTEYKEKELELTLSNRAKNTKSE